MTPEEIAELREKISREVAKVMTQSHSWPWPIAIHMLGRDLSKPIEKITDAVLSVVIALRTEEKKSCH